MEQRAVDIKWNQKSETDGKVVCMTEEEVGGTVGGRRKKEEDFHLSAWIRITGRGTASFFAADPHMIFQAL
jgi:hypothetical protein